MADMNEEKLISQRLTHIKEYCKQHPSLVNYVILAGLMLFAFWLRTRNLPLLRDVTTGGWTLGPDLDPFLFLRWAEYIVQHGSIMAHDTLRYVPLGFDTAKELLLLPYMIAYFHKILLILGVTDSVTHSAVLFPAVMFSFTVLIFFLLGKEIFRKKLGDSYASALALIASFFLIVIPALLPRTIAGIPEKESIGFMFMFLAFYGFIVAWNRESLKAKASYLAIAIIGTVAMANAWGGHVYIFATIGLAMLFALLYNQVTRTNYLLYTIWLWLSIAVILISTDRYTFIDFVISPTTAINLFAFTALSCFMLLQRTQKKLPLSSKMPEPLYALLLTVILSVISVLIILGPNFILGQIINVKNTLVTPIADRLGVTVAENRQPFFTEWVGSFGNAFGVSPFFILFLTGGTILIYSLFIQYERRTRILITASFIYFLLAIIFSRYDPSKLLNGTNIPSLLFYASGFLAIIIMFGSVYIKKELPINLDFGYILLTSLFFFSLISARGSVRTIMVLVPAAALLASYTCIFCFKKNKESERENKKYWLRAGISVALALLYIGGLAGASSLFSSTYCQGTSINSFLKESYCTAQGFAPSAYTQQWQQTMAWVRENTPTNAVFAHWWDYGYWVQSIGKRATVLDGGNAIAYWNHLMGRLVLTGSETNKALTFLKTHNASHLLIDSTDIGKYGAFSSIGSAETYDRRSFLPTLTQRQVVKETKNGTLYLYQGGFALDGDITYNLNGTQVFFPEGVAGVAGVLTEFKSSQASLGQPALLVIYKGNQYALPLRYTYFHNQLVDFGSGIDAGIFVFDRLTVASGQPSIQKDSALLYLSSKVIHSHLAQLYLFNQKLPGFTLVHQEDDTVVKSINQQDATALTIPFINDEVYGGIRGGPFAGPIKIWRIDYPLSQEINSSYLNVSFPNSALNKA